MQDMFLFKKTKYMFYKEKTKYWDHNFDKNIYFFKNSIFLVHFLPIDIPNYKFNLFEFDN